MNQALRTLQVVVVTGPRQTGKSAFVEFHPALQDRPYLSLDGATVLRRVRDNPVAFVRSEWRMTIDEVQREPELILAVKSVVDRQRPSIRGQFVLKWASGRVFLSTIPIKMA